MIEIPQDIWEVADAVHYAAVKAETVMEEVDIIARAILAERERNKWRPIGTAPRDGSEFLAARKNFGTECMVVVSYHSNGHGQWWVNDENGLYNIDTFTDWMPLPAPPKEQSE